MNIRKIELNGVVIAVVEGSEKLITDVQSALELIAAVQYESGSNRIIVEKRAVADEFFILSNGLAGQVLQKFINYHTKLAVVGNYSQYTSKPFHDFIYESNRGRDVFFVGTEEEAVQRLSRA